VLFLQLLLLLPLSACGGEHAGDEPAPTPSSDRVVVLFSNADTVGVATLAPAACKPGQCERIDLETFHCRAPQHAASVIVTGHSAPPHYLNSDPTRVADAIACFSPELVVLDTCYGFSMPLLAEIAIRSKAAVIVGSTYRIAISGLHYDPEFFIDRDAAARAAAIHDPDGTSIERWTVAPPDVERSLADVATWDSSRLHAGLQSIDPNLVRVPLGRSATVLVPVPRERF
jgi:hypothetical protein